jgi:bifunctional DNase/RNase
MSKKSRLPSAAFFVLILLSIAGIALYNMYDTKGYVPVNVLQVSGNTIVLGNNCTAIISDTSSERAYSIETGIAGIIDERPNTYDIFAEALRSFNITLDHVTIDDYRNGTYYANLYLENENKVLKLDCRPSDAIALSLRTNSTIYINSTLLQKYGSNIC